MDKKPLIGVSICAVVLLVLGSLSNVVGYQSVKSTTMNDSPLFQTRTQRATNQEQNIITSRYLGMGKENLLQFTIQDNRNEQLKKAIEIINKMDEQSFAQLTKFCIERVHQNPAFDNIGDDGIKQMLQLIRSKPALLKLYTPNQSLKMPMSIEPCWPTIDPWFPGCMLLAVLLVSLIYILAIFVGTIQFIIWLIQVIINAIKEFTYEFIHSLTFNPCLMHTYHDPC